MKMITRRMNAKPVDNDVHDDIFQAVAFDGHELPQPHRELAAQILHIVLRVDVPRAQALAQTWPRQRARPRAQHGPVCACAGARAQARAHARAARPRARVRVRARARARARKRARVSTRACERARERARTRKRARTQARTHASAHARCDATPKTETFGNSGGNSTAILGNSDPKMAIQPFWGGQRGAFSSGFWHLVGNSATHQLPIIKLERGRECACGPRPVPQAPTPPPLAPTQVSIA